MDLRRIDAPYKAFFKIQHVVFDPRTWRRFSKMYNDKDARRLLRFVAEYTTVNRMIFARMPYREAMKDLKFNRFKLHRLLNKLSSDGWIFIVKSKNRPVLVSPDVPKLILEAGSPESLDDLFDALHYLEVQRERLIRWFSRDYDALLREGYELNLRGSDSIGKSKCGGTHDVCRSV